MHTTHLVEELDDGTAVHVARADVAVGGVEQHCVGRSDHAQIDLVMRAVGMQVLQRLLARVPELRRALDALDHDLGG